MRLKNEAWKIFHVSKINYCICYCSCADCIRNWNVAWFTSAGPCHLLSTTALQFRVSVLESACAHTHTPKHIHIGIHSHVACHSTSLGESRGEYGGWADMDDVGTEQTPMWFHSSDTRINRNVFAQQLKQKWETGSEQWKRGWETVEEDSQGCLSDPLIKQPEFSDSFHLNRTLKSVFCNWILSLLARPNASRDGKFNSWDIRFGRDLMALFSL